MGRPPEIDTEGDFLHIEWDHNKFPKRPSEWSSFIDELARQQQHAKPFEDFWLEQKSEMEPLKSPGIGKIAKCILGMANRLPDVAEKAMEGHGLMVCGLSGGQRVGVPRTEDHELENALHPFLGSSGPLWITHRLPADDEDREVLVIVIDAPCDGDPIFACHKESIGVLDGGIYTRSKTQSRAVRGQEHDALVARLLAGSDAPELDIAVDLITPLHAVKWGPDLLDIHLNEMESSLLASLQAAEQGSPRTVISRSLAGPFTSEEKRSPAEFRRIVEEWKASGKNCVDDVAKEYTSMALPGAVFRILNKTNTYLKGVELRVHLEGAVESVLHDNSSKLRLTQHLPSRPRPYGPHEIPMGGSIPKLMSPTGFTGLNWQSSFRNSGSVDAVFDEPALRPKGALNTDESDSVLFLPGGQPGDIINGTWTLTAEGIDAVLEGTIRIEVGPLLELVPEMFREVAIDVPQGLR